MTETVWFGLSYYPHCATLSTKTAERASSVLAWLGGVVRSFDRIDRMVVVSVWGEEHLI